MKILYSILLRWGRFIADLLHLLHFLNFYIQARRILVSGAAEALLWGTEFWLEGRLTPTEARFPGLENLSSGVGA